MTTLHDCDRFLQFLENNFLNKVSRTISSSVSVDLTGGANWGWSSNSKKYSIHCIHLFNVYISNQKLCRFNFDLPTIWLWLLRHTSFSLAISFVWSLSGSPICIAECHHWENTDIEIAPSTNSLYAICWSRIRVDDNPGTWHEYYIGNQPQNSSSYHQANSTNSISSWSSQRFYFFYPIGIHSKL